MDENLNPQSVEQTTKFTNYSSFANLLNTFSYKFSSDVCSMRPEFEPRFDDIFPDMVQDVQQSIQANECDNHMQLGIEEPTTIDKISTFSESVYLTTLTQPEIASFVTLSLCSYLMAKVLSETSQDNLLEAVSRLNDAYHYLGVAVGISINEFLFDESQEILGQRKRAAASGGSAAKGFNKMTAQIKQLLVDLKPENGWRNKSDAARKIAEVFLHDPEYPGKKTSDREEDIGRITQHVKNKLSDRKSDLPDFFEENKR